VPNKNFVYNYLYFQDEIQLGTNNKIKNFYIIYDVKIFSFLINILNTIRTDYVGDLIYKNGILETVFHDEGRIKVALDTSIVNWSDTLGNHFWDTTITLATRYQYFIQDHLGKNRVIFEKLNDSLFVAQHVDYYPFESPHQADSLYFAFTYQGKEYINFLGYDAFDFHARCLDTWTGRFSGLDPVVNYSLSGYASMMNNPLLYIDPDGRNPIAIGAFVAIFANSALKMAQGKSINSMWDFLKPGIAGAVGGGFGSLAPIGALPGMAYGAGSGAVTGTITSALNGSNIGKGALYGAIGGGVFGGLNGYLSTPEGVNPWTGNGTTNNALSMSAYQSGNNWTSTEEMRTSYDGTIGLKDNMSLSEIEDKINTNVSLSSKNNLPSKDYFMDNGTIAFTKADGSIGHAGGVTNASYKFGFIKNSYIRISPSLKSTAIEYQNLVFKHEFMHAWHWSSGFKNYNLYTERATSAYTLAYIKAYNLGDNWASTTRNVISSEGGMYYPKNYSWRNFNKIIKLWLN
jgi:RHS repeat-associated protein